MPKPFAFRAGTAKHCSCMISRILLYADSVLRESARWVKSSILATYFAQRECNLRGRYTETSRDADMPMKQNKCPTPCTAS